MNETESGLQDYDALVSSRQWRARLASLNEALTDALDEYFAPRLLNGNLFYDHLQPDFHNAPLLPECEQKRRRLFEAAQRAKTMLEIGVNGGHSLFLALSANPALRCVGIDLARQAQPGWGRVDVYVPAAIEWLQREFPRRVRYFEGDSRIVAPTYVLRDGAEKIDLLHLDGDKKTYMADYFNLRPLLRKGALVVIDDTNMKMCRKIALDLEIIGELKRHPDFPETPNEKYQNLVMEVV